MGLLGGEEFVQRMMLLDMYCSLLESLIFCAVNLCLDPSQRSLDCCTACVDDGWCSIHCGRFVVLVRDVAAFVYTCGL